MAILFSENTGKLIAKITGKVLAIYTLRKMTDNSMH
jgi:hypothetical protein